MMDTEGEVLQVVYDMVPDYDEMYEIRGLIAYIIKQGIKGEEVCPWSFYDDYTHVSGIIVKDVYLARDDHIYVEFEVSEYNEKLDTFTSYTETVRMFDEIIEYVERRISEDYIYIVHDVLDDMGFYGRVEELIQEGKLDLARLEEFIEENYYDEIRRRLEDKIEEQVAQWIAGELSLKPYSKMFCGIERVIKKIQENV